MSYQANSELERLAESLALELDCLLDALSHERDTKLGIKDLRNDFERFSQLVREALSQQRQILDFTPVAITVHDATGRILDANQYASNMFGYGLDAMRRLTVFELNPDLPLDHMQRFARALPGDQSREVETTNLHADGHRFPVEVRSSVFVERGHTRIVAAAIDVSGRIASRESLKRAEARLVDLLNSVDKGVYVQDTKLRTVLLNDAARRVFDRIGLSPDRFEAELRALKVIDERGRALTFEELPQVRVLKTRQAIDSAVLGVMSPTSHRMIWLKLSVQPRLDQQTGQVQQIITAFSDVSELKRSSELFDEAQRLASAGGFEYDMVDEVLFFTEHTYCLFGLDPSKPVIARELLNLMRGSDRERAKAALYNFLREPQSVDLELRVALNGGTGWIRVLARPQLNDGKILRVTGIVRDITAQKNEEERLKRQAEQDALTGLVNRDSFLTALRQAIEATRAQGTGPAVLFVDLDRFKVLNDLLGHAAGDRLIAACGQRLRNNVPTSCLVARIGADEFAVLVPEARSEDLISQVAERIHRAFQRGFVDRGEDFLITASIGLARHPVHGESAEDLLRHADAAMQDAKRRGRNRWLPFSAALADSLKRELLIETQLRKALESHELRLVYQPKLDLASSRVIGAEALLRWRSKVLGDMSPEIFIPHAETTGDIVQIGQFVLREACRQLGDWRRQGLKLDHVAVNVSYRQFLSERFEGDIADALLDQGLDGSSLELELTERALIEDSPEVLETVAALRRLGVGLCIDDFGEGYSALGLLRKFQVQGLKISHKFMHGIPHHPVDTKLCEVIVQMARALDVKVTAEGVENQQQWRFLSALGAQYGQGFLFARPLEVEDFEAYLRANSS